MGNVDCGQEGLTAKREKTYSFKVLDKNLKVGLTERVTAGPTTEINTLLTRTLGETISFANPGLRIETFHHDD